MIMRKRQKVRKARREPTVSRAWLVLEGGVVTQVGRGAVVGAQLSV
jgi:hypothetical protein